VKKAHIGTARRVKVSFQAIRKVYSENLMEKLIGEITPLERIRDILHLCPWRSGRLTSEGLLAQVKVVWPRLSERIQLIRIGKRIFIKISVQTKNISYSRKTTGK